MVKPLKQQELRDEGWYTRPLINQHHQNLHLHVFLFQNLQTLMVGHCSDSDIIFLTDIKELFDLTDDKYAVMCVQHDYTSKKV